MKIASSSSISKSLIQFLWQSDTTYFSSSDWSALDFLLPRKCKPVKYKARQKAGLPIVTETRSLYYTDSYLLSSGKKQWQSFRTSYKNLFSALK